MGPCYLERAFAAKIEYLGLGLGFGSAHRGANGVAMPTDEDDQDGRFFYNHPERGGYFAA